VNTTQITALLHPFVKLDEQRLSQTSTYINLILKWNSRVNLTAVRRPEEIVTRHFGESFFVAARLLPSGESQSVIDLGSGAGFPGIPLAMLAPQAQVTLIESNSKKATFLNEVVRALNLNNVTVFNQRGETYSTKAELVTMRAVEKFDSSLVVASRLVKSGGRLALMIGRGQLERAQDSDPALLWSEPIDIFGAHSRMLLVGTKSVNVE
jgi:16S rRNA (guanine527-N7)-methyltransferase